MWSIIINILQIKPERYYYIIIINTLLIKKNVACAWHVYFNISNERNPENVVKFAFNCINGRVLPETIDSLVRYEETRGMISIGVFYYHKNTRHICIFSLRLHQSHVVGECCANSRTRDNDFGAPCCLANSNTQTRIIRVYLGYNSGYTALTHCRIDIDQLDDGA